MPARPSYLAPRYMEVSRDVYCQYLATVERCGQVETLEAPLPLALTDGLAFIAGTVGAVPMAGDDIGVGATDRLDIFTADKRYFALYES
jgi:hypothetical protein